MTQIYIYQDYVYNNGGLWATLSGAYGAEKLRFIDSKDIINNILQDKPKAFFMPGGASRYVSNKLYGSGNSKIKEYVSGGGLYIGICAGAYYACRRTEWQAGQDGEICVDNELGFFPGVARGPIHNGASIERIETDDGQTFNGLNWFAPEFVSDETGYTVLARYADLPGQPAAIVTGAYGQGRYLLFSPHLEVDSDQLLQMQFDVPDNRMQELVGLNAKHELDKNNFINIIQKFIK